MAIDALHTLTRQQYEDLRFAVIAALEGKERLPYVDNAKERNPTIGIGFNLRDTDSRRRVFDALGIGPGPAQTALENVIDDRSIRDNATLRARLDAAYGAPFAFAAGAVGDQQIRSVFDILVQEKETIVKSLTGVQSDSLELLVLTSLGYNSFDLIGPKLRAALLVNPDSAEARAEAWYEIRYGSNSKKDVGLAHRRYLESELFGLYGQGVSATNITEEQARAVARVYTRHRFAIEAYERLFGIWDGARGSKRNASGRTGLEEAGLTLSALGLSGVSGSAEVGTIYQELANARGFLIDQYITTNTQFVTKPAIDGDVLVANIDGSGPSGESGRSGFAGTTRADLMLGDRAADWVFGDRGDDVLFGGAGHDTYDFLSGDGEDVIVDQDGVGALVRNHQKLALGLNIGVNQWVRGATTFTRDGNDLVIRFADTPSDKITIKNFDFARASQDYLGIRLIDAPAAPTGEVRAFLGDREDYDSDPAEPGTQTQTDAFGNTVRADGQEGRPDIAQPERADLFFGSSADEIERFATAGGDDAVNADGPDSATSSAGGRDLIETGAGRDVVAAGGNNDWVEGGTEGDILTGNAGNDVLFAETSNGQRLTIEGAIAAGESGVQAPGPGEILSGDAGDDVLLSGAGADLLLGGEGEEVIVAGAGDDTVYGDASLVSASVGWTVARTRIDNPDGSVRFDVAFTNATTAGTDAAGGLDVILGGAGEDWIFAGAGDDAAEGGEGNDVILGEAGNDALRGGAGNDFLDGDSGATAQAGLAGDDYLDGGAGDDELLGNVGNDVLYGGAGDDVLSGGAGEDTLYAGAGTDVLAGGAGKDSYVFERGDGLEVVLDIPTGADDPEASVLALGPGITAADVKFRLGSLVVDVGGGDAIHFNGFNPDDPLATPVLDSIQFADGTLMTYEDVLAQGFDLEGTDGDDFISGTAVTDRIDAKGGNDTILAKAGDDSILGGEGNDDIDAGAGDDVVDAGPGHDIVDGREGNDTLTSSGGSDFVYGGPGDDAIFAADGDTVIDTEGVNTLDLSAYAGLTGANLEITQYESADGEQYLNLHVRDDLNPGATPEAGGVSVERGEAGHFTTVTVADGAGGTLALDYATLMSQYAAQGFVYKATDESQTLIGTPFDDTIFAFGGEDTVNAGAGD
ncbi:MAG: calcium-binding protein, partial [Pseudomonadota bacterium]